MVVEEQPQPSDFNYTSVDLRVLQEAMLIRTKPKLKTKQNKNEMMFLENRTTTLKYKKDIRLTSFILG